MTTATLHPIDIFFGRHTDAVRRELRRLTRVNGVLAELNQKLEDVREQIVATHEGSSHKISDLHSTLAAHEAQRTDLYEHMNKLKAEIKELEKIKFKKTTGLQGIFTAMYKGTTYYNEIVGKHLQELQENNEALKEAEAQEAKLNKNCSKIRDKLGPIISHEFAESALLDEINRLQDLKQQAISELDTLIIRTCMHTPLTILHHKLAQLGQETILNDILHIRKHPDILHTMASPDAKTKRTPPPLPLSENHVASVIKRGLYEEKSPQHLQLRMHGEARAKVQRKNANGQTYYRRLTVELNGRMDGHYHIAIQKWRRKGVQSMLTDSVSAVYTDSEIAPATIHSTVDNAVRSAVQRVRSTLFQPN